MGGGTEEAELEGVAWAAVGRAGGGWGGFSGRGGGLEELGRGVLLLAEEEERGRGPSENICIGLWAYGSRKNGCMKYGSMTELVYECMEV